MQVNNCNLAYHLYINIFLDVCEHMHGFSKYNIQFILISKQCHFFDSVHIENQAFGLTLSLKVW